MQLPELVELVASVVGSDGGLIVMVVVTVLIALWGSNKSGAREHAATIALANVGQQTSARLDRFEERYDNERRARNQERADHQEREILLQERIDEMTREIDTLKRQLEELREGSAKRQEELEAELAIRTEERDRAIRERDEARREIRRLNQDVSELRDSNTQQAATLMNLQTQVNELKENQQGKQAA